MIERMGGDMGKATPRGAKLRTGGHDEQDARVLHVCDHAVDRFQTRGIDPVYILKDI